MTDINHTTHTGALLHGAAESDRRTRKRIANLHANALLVAGDLPDPAAAGYLLLLFDQCRLYHLTHDQLVEVFGRPLLAFLNLTLQAVEQMAARSRLGANTAGANEAGGALRTRPLTPYQAARLHDLAGEYVEALPDEQALEALLLLFDVLEIFELSAGQMETVLGARALRTLTRLVYGERADRPATGAVEATPSGLPATGANDAPVLRVGGRPVPFFGTVGENGHVTYTPEARLWLRYIGQGGDAPHGCAGGGDAGEDAGGVQP